METSDRDALIAKTVRVERILLGALLAGILLFALVASSVVWGRRPDEAGTPLLIIACVFAGIQSVMSQVLPRIMVDKQRRQPTESATRSDNERLLGIHTGALLLGSALLEGAAFFLLVSLIVTGRWWLLLLVAALMGLMMKNWPSVERLERWLEEQRDLMERTF